MANFRLSGLCGLCGGSLRTAWFDAEIAEHAEEAKHHSRKIRRITAFNIQNTSGVLPG